MFRRKVVSYLAVKHGKNQPATPFTAPAFLDTLQISIKTDRTVYPAGTKSVSVSLNNNSKVLFFGEDYMVARKEGNQWLLLNGNNAWIDIGIRVRQGMDISIYSRSLSSNDNKLGNYRVYKEIGFYDSKEKWFMAAEFRIE